MRKCISSFHPCVSGASFQPFVSLLLSYSDYWTLPAEDHLPVSVAADWPSLLRPPHALPRGRLPLLSQHLQHWHQWPQHVSLLQISHLPAASLLQQPISELPVQLLPVLRHRLWLLPVFHGGTREHRGRALSHPPAVLLRYRRHRRHQQPDEPGPECPEWRCGGRWQPQQLPHRHERFGSPGWVRLEALLTNTQRDNRALKVKYDNKPNMNTERK